jgi:anti-sigma factor RsiW
MKNFKDIEQLSSYLDGQLNSSDSKRLEERISSSPELASALHDIRSARGILRKLPARKAPRNFTLTRKMVGLKPPLPQSYSFFRFSSAFATILLVLTFAANSLAPRLSSPVPAFAYGMGGGGAPDEAPAATEAPAAAAEMLPATEAPSLDAPVAPNEMPTASADLYQTEEAAPEASTMLKDDGADSAPQEQTRVMQEPFIPATWQITLLAVILISALLAYVINQNAKKKWS